MLDSTDSLDERLARRRARRWQRRARIAGPFLAVPAMLGLLVLSVDLIEYRPAARTEPAKARTMGPVRPEPGRPAMIQAPEAALAVSVVETPLADTLPGNPAATAPDARGDAPASASPLPAWVADTAVARPR